METMGISQPELVKRLKKHGVVVSQMTISRLISGKTLNPIKPTTKQVAAALGVRHSRLCHGAATVAHAAKALAAATSPGADLAQAGIANGSWHHTGADAERVAHELRAPFAFQCSGDLQGALALWAGLSSGLSALPPSLRLTAQGIIDNIALARNFQLYGKWAAGDQPADWFERLEGTDKDLFSMVAGIRTLDGKRAGGSHGLA